MVILIDLDGTIADFPAEWNRRWTERFPERVFVPTNSYTKMEIEKNYPHEYKDDIQEIYNSKGFYANLSLLPGSLEALEWLDGEGYYVFLCTKPLSSYHSNNTSCMAEKCEWVQKTLGNKWIDKLIITRDKTIVHGDILIDDNPYMTKGLLTRPPWNPVLFEQPWNRRPFLPGEMQLVPRVNWENYQILLSLIK